MTLPLTAIVGGRAFTLREEPTPRDKIGAWFVEEDTYQVLSAPPELREPSESPLHTLTAALEVEPLPRGTARLTRIGGQLTVLAIIHDLDAEPSIQLSDLEAAFADGLRLLEGAGVTRAETPLLGTLFGSIEPEVAVVGILQGAARTPAQRLRAVDIVAGPRSPEVMERLESALLGVGR